MILTGRAATNNEKMDKVTSSSQDEQKSSYPKRSSVVELWRKREGTIRSSNSTRTTPTGDKTIDNKFEEKKECNQRIGVHSEQDSRQNEKSYDYTKNAASERSEPESTIETDDNTEKRVAKIRKQVVASPPRRSNIRDSWKKRAANTPPLSSPPHHPSTPKIATNLNSNTPCSPVIYPEPESASNCSSSMADRQSLDASLDSSPTVESFNSSTSVKRSGFRSSWCNRGGESSTNSVTTSSSSKSIDEQTAKDGKVSTSSVIERSYSSASHNSAGHNSCTSETPSNTTSLSAFGELKSKWAKFEVQQQAHPSTKKETNNKLSPQLNTPDKSSSRNSPSVDQINQLIVEKPKEQEETPSVESSPLKIKFRSNISAIHNKPVTVEGRGIPLNVFENRQKLSKLGQTSNRSRIDNFRKISPDKCIKKNTGSDSSKETKSSSASSLASKEITKEYPSRSKTLPSRLSSRRKLDSKILRSKYTRRQTTASSISSNTEKSIDDITTTGKSIDGITTSEKSIDDITKNSLVATNSSAHFIPVKQNIASSFVSVEHKSVNHLLPSTEKELVPSFPLEESLQDYSSNLYKTSTKIDMKKNAATDPQLSGTKRESTKVAQLSKLNFADASIIAVPKSNSNTFPKTENHLQSPNNKSDRSSFGSCSSTISKSRNGSSEAGKNDNSRTSLTSRANRKLRDIRLRQQQARNSKNEGQDCSSVASSKESSKKALMIESQESIVVPSSSKKNDMKASVSHDRAIFSLDVSCPPDDSAQPKSRTESPVQTPQHVDSRPPASSPTIRRTRTNESFGSSIISMDESTALSPSLCSETTYSNSQMHSTYASEFTTGNASIAGESKNSQRSPLHDVVPDADKMVPEEFVSEKNTNVDSFKTAVERTSIGQLAKDMTEEASSVLGLDIFNNGMQNAINKLVIGDIFQQKKSPPKKLPKRAPSPIEEVAIEVEYVADSD